MVLTRKVEQYLENKKDSSIYLRADKMLDYGFVMHVMATVKEAGIENIGMITEP